MSFQPVAPIEPDEPFDEDAYLAMTGAAERLTGKTVDTAATLREAGLLQEAYNANQPRFPKGSPKAGQWRPKLVTGVGRLAPGHLTRDLKALSDLVEQATVYGPGGVGGHHLDAIGDQLEATALRYSARKHYEKRLDAIRVERNAIQDAGWEKYETAWRAEPDPDKAAKIEMRDFLEPGDSQKLIDLVDEEVRTRNQRDFADRDAMLGVLQKLRPMGGKLNPSPEPNQVDGSGIRLDYVEANPGVSEVHAMDADLERNLKEVLKVVPTAWLDDTNGKGSVRFLFSKDRAWANTQTVDEKPQVDSFAEMEDATDQALAGQLPTAKVAQAAIDVMNARGDTLPKLSTDEKLTLRDSPVTKSWRDRRSQVAATLAGQRYAWIGRAQTDNYPDGLWAVLRGQDDRRRYYLDWGGNLHLLDTMEAAPRTSGTGAVITGKREDRRLNLPSKLTNKQSDALDRAHASGDVYMGMYDGKYPVLLRAGTTESGVGPYAAIYDWVNEDGETKNLGATPDADNQLQAQDAASEFLDGAGYTPTMIQKLQGKAAANVISKKYPPGWAPSTKWAQAYADAYVDTYEPEVGEDQATQMADELFRVIKGATGGMRRTTTTPPGGFDESKWDREAPRPPTYAAALNTLIKVDPRKKSTLLHELGHRLEVVYGDQNQAGYHPISMHTHRFLAARTAGESLQKLQDLYPGYAYDEHELARPDKFVDAYVGKNYPGEATEVLTMGMEILWYPQYGTRDINEDPGMRRFILGLLATL